MSATPSLVYLVVALAFLLGLVLALRDSRDRGAGLGIVGTAILVLLIATFLTRP
jgi:hypothetical protein